MKEIIKATRLTIDSKRLINKDPSKFYKIIGKNSLIKRESYRNFTKDTKSKFAKSDLYDFYDKFTELLSILDLNESVVSLAFVDNRGIISGPKKMYRISDSNFINIETNKPIDRDSLYIQEEMHDATIVMFFLWDSEVLQVDHGRYKDVLLTSGFLGHQLHMLATRKNFKGTMFAGLTLVEFYGLTNYDFDDKIPIFAIALE